MGSHFPRRDGGLGGEEATSEERAQWAAAVAAGDGGTPTLQRFLQSMARYRNGRLQAASEAHAGASAESERLEDELAELKNAGELWYHR